MVCNPRPSSKTLVAAFVAATFGVSAGAALAQTTTSHDSRDVAVANSPAARHVVLTNRQNARTLHYSSARNLRICNLSGRSESLTAQENAAARNAPEDRINLTAQAGNTVPPTPVPLQVGFAGINHQIEPGNCYEFRARDVRLSPAQRMPSGSGLIVAISPVSGNAFVNGRTEAAPKESVQQLKEELKQDDEQEQQANAELSHAREKLSQTTRDLNQTQSKEQHVASAERHTAQAAQREQQKAESQQSGQPSQQDGGTPR